MCPTRRAQERAAEDRAQRDGPYKDMEAASINPSRPLSKGLSLPDLRMGLIKQGFELFEFVSGGGFSVKNPHSILATWLSFFEARDHFLRTHPLSLQLLGCFMHHAFSNPLCHCMAAEASRGTRSLKCSASSCRKKSIKHRPFKS